MCKKKQFKYCPSTIDDCMKKLIDNIQWLLGKDFGSEEQIIFEETSQSVQESQSK